MVKAGRVAIVPKGEFILSTQYTRLDMVTYNGMAYVAKKDNASILPTNEEYWMLLVTSSVTSVNGQTGTVNITPENIGAIPGKDLLTSIEQVSANTNPGHGVDALVIKQLSNYYEMLEYSNISPEVRRNVFRGKNLGSVYTNDQKAQVKAGTFKDLFIGDYWEINDKIWRIVDINYWLNSGDTACTTPHLVIMPDQYLYTAQMNETHITTGGYVGSKMYTENLENANTLVYAAFGETAVLKHREYLTNAVTDGHASAGAWYDSKVELPNEIMMYGSYVFTAAGDGSFVPTQNSIDKTQLALMAAHPRYINPARQNQWLRDVVSLADFALVSINGDAASGNAAASRGVRPVFGVVG